MFCGGLFQGNHKEAKTNLYNENQYANGKNLLYFLQF
jgi:hypothetical protein